MGSHSSSGCHHIEAADQISHYAPETKENAENTKWNIIIFMDSTTPSHLLWPTWLISWKGETGL